MQEFFDRIFNSYIAETRKDTTCSKEELSYKIALVEEAREHGWTEFNNFLKSTNAGKDMALVTPEKLLTWVDGYLVGRAGVAGSQVMAKKLAEAPKAPSAPSLETLLRRFNVGRDN